MKIGATAVERRRMGSQHLKHSEPMRTNQPEEHSERYLITQSGIWQALLCRTVAITYTQLREPVLLDRFSAQRIDGGAIDTVLVHWRQLKT